MRSLLPGLVAVLVLLPACRGDKPGAEATPGGAGTAAPGAGPAAAAVGQDPTGKAPAAPTPSAPPILPADPGGHSGKHRWSARLGGPLADAGRAVAIDAKGNVAVVGYVRGAVELDSGDPLAADDADGFVALYDATGKLAWARNFGGRGEDTLGAVAFDGEGNVVVGGAMSYELVMADGKLTSVGADDALLVKLAPDGRRLWAKRFGGTDVDAINGVAADAAGNIYVTGEFAQHADFAGTALDSAGMSDAFVAKLGPDGAPLWVKRFGALGVDLGRAVRPAADGGIVLLAEVSREVDFGGGVREGFGNRDVAVIKLGPDGSHQWSTRFGGSNDELALGLALDPVGAVLITGTFDGELGFGAARYRSAGLADAYVAKLGPDGAPLWLKSFGNKEADYGGGVATDGSGNVYAVGWFWYQVDLGKGPVKSAGKKDCYALALAPDGQALWAQRFGGAENEYLQGVAIDAAGHPVAVGTFHRMINFGGADLTAAADARASMPLGDVAIVALER